MSLPKYAELTHVNRGDPCQEYPGRYLSYLNGDDERSFESLEEARQDAYQRMPFTAPEMEASVCYSCSDDDPRIGQVWFTGFYQVGKYNRWGQWIA